MAKCSLCKVGNIREQPEFRLCPNCLKDVSGMFAVLLEMSDGGKKEVDMEKLIERMDREWK